MNRLICLGLLAISTAAAAQVATRPTTGTRSPAGTRPAPASSLPKNLERSLQDLVTLDVEGVKLSVFSRQLGDLTQTNVVFNWTALAKSGVTRDTPLTLHLKDVPYETVVRTLTEVLPVDLTLPGGAANRPNYIIGDNTLELTTNAEIGKDNSSKPYDISRAIAYTFNAQADKAEQQQNAKLVEGIIRAELARAGEPVDVKGHEILTKESTLAATLSDRGLGVLERALGMIVQPAKVGQLPPGILMTASAKRADTALKAAVGKMGVPEMGLAYVALAREPQKYAGTLNIALVPGTAEELAKEKPEIGAAVTDGGVVLVGPKEALNRRTVMGVYDLRDLIKRIAAKSTRKPTAAECQSAIVQLVQIEIKAEGQPGGKWGGVEDLGKLPAVLVPYNGILVVFATQDMQRTVAGALQDMNK